MKRRNIFMIVLGSVFAIGLILMIVGWFMGGSFVKRNIVMNDNDKSVSLKIPAGTNNEDIKNLDFKLSAGSVTIKEGDTFSIKGRSLSENKIENGTWKVRSHKYKSIFSFLGVNIETPGFHFFSHSDKWHYDITVPRNSHFDTSYINLSAGSLSIDKLDSKSTTIKVNAGSADINTLNTDDFTCKVNTGDIKLTHVAINKDASLKCNAGAIDVGNKSTVSSNIMNDLTAKCNLGSINAYGKITGDNSLSSNMGSVELTLPGTRDNYDFRSTKCTMGDGDISHGGTKTSNEQFGSFDIDCNMGEYDVNFQ